MFLQNDQIRTQTIMKNYKNAFIANSDTSVMCLIIYFKNHYLMQVVSMVTMEKIVQRNVKQERMVRSVEEHVNVQSIGAIMYLDALWV